MLKHLGLFQRADLLGLAHREDHVARAVSAPAEGDVAARQVPRGVEALLRRRGSLDGAYLAGPHALTLTVLRNEKGTHKRIL